MRLKHLHRCACGTRLVCAQDADHCAVIEPWACPTCLQNQRDEYFQQYAELRARRAQRTEDPSYADHR